ncbi:hypothetical protein ES703_76238 [subsurface metagenome]
MGVELGLFDTLKIKFKLGLQGATEDLLGLNSPCCRNEPQYGEGENKEFEKDSLVKLEVHEKFLFYSLSPEIGRISSSVKEIICLDRKYSSSKILRVIWGTERDLQR